MNSDADSRHYRRPGWFTKHVFNNAVAGLTRLGISVLGSRVLEVRGRTTGELRRTPVNLLTIAESQYHPIWREDGAVALSEVELKDVIGANAMYSLSSRSSWRSG